jgi:hypothetical protein
MTAGFPKAYAVLTLLPWLLGVCACSEAAPRAGAGGLDGSVTSGTMQSGSGGVMSGAVADAAARETAAGAAAQSGAAGLAGAGAGRAAGGAGAAGVSNGVEPVIPIERGGKYALEFDGLVLEVDPRVGARIVTFSLEGKNVLTGSDIDGNNWGSTFWPSPQQRWNWPPVPEIDTEPYTSSIVDNAIVLTSAVGNRARVRVTKRLRADRARRAIEIEYALENTDSATAQWAPWEVSRVAAGGITFFPTGDTKVSTNLPVKQAGAVTWYQHDPNALGNSGQKFSGDGRGGWLAHVAGRLLFLKTFADVPPNMQAPAPEAEIEIYAATKYVELEPQGVYTTLLPGEHLKWSVRWYLRPLPDSVAAVVGDAALVEFAQSLVAQ